MEWTSAGDPFTWQVRKIIEGLQVALSGQSTMEALVDLAVFDSAMDIAPRCSYCGLPMPLMDSVHTIDPEGIDAEDTLRVQATVRYGICCLGPISIVFQK